jgi:hypothetical protein
MNWLTKPRFSWKETGAFLFPFIRDKVLSGNIASFSILAWIYINFSLTGRKSRRVPEQGEFIGGEIGFTATNS